MNDDYDSWMSDDYDKWMNDDYDSRMSDDYDKWMNDDYDSWMNDVWIISESLSYYFYHIIMIMSTISVEKQSRTLF